MKSYDEIKGAIVSAMSNPDTMETAMSGVLADLESDYNEHAALVNDFSKAESRIRDLQDTNHKLFLAQTGTPDGAGEEEPELPTGKDVITEFINKVNDISKKEE